MFSTGPMALSAEHMRYPSRVRSTHLRVLAEPAHHLSGRVTTPLFTHLGASSWHRDDAKFFKAFKHAFGSPWAAVGALCALGAVGWGVGWAVRRRRGGGRGKTDEDGEEGVGLLSPRAGAAAAGRRRRAPSWFGRTRSRSSERARSPLGGGRAGDVRLEDGEEDGRLGERDVELALRSGVGGWDDKRAMGLGLGRGEDGRD